MIKHPPAWRGAYSDNELAEVVRRVRKASIGIQVADLHPNFIHFMTFVEHVSLNGLFSDTITIQIAKKYADMNSKCLALQIKIRQCHLLCRFATISKHSYAAVVRLASEFQRVKTLRSPAKLSGQRTILMMLKPTLQCGPAEELRSAMKGSIVAVLPKQHSALAELAENLVFNELHNNHTATYNDVVDCIMDRPCSTQI